MIRMCWAVLLVVLCGVAPARADHRVEKVVDEFVATLHEESFSAFDRVRGGGNIEQWGDVRTLMQRFRCIVLSSAVIRSIGQEGGRTIVELDLVGTGTMRGASARTKAIPARWTLTLDTSGAPGAVPRIVAAEMTESIVARELAAALPRPPDTTTLLARGLDLGRLARKLAYDVADPAYQDRGEPAMTWATNTAIELGDRSAEAYCRALHATLFVIRGDLERARASASEALRIAEEEHDADTQVAALFPLAFVASATAGQDAGLRYFHRAADLLPLSDDPQPALRALHMASYYESLRGNFAAALNAAEKLSRESAKAGWPEGVTMARFTLATVQQQLGDEAAVQELCRRIIADTERQGETGLATAARIGLAGSLMHSGQREQAQEIIRMATPQIGRMTSWDQPGAYVQLAAYAQMDRDFDRARELLRTARDAYAASGASVPPYVMQLESEIAYESGDLSGALSSAARALEAYQADNAGTLPYASAWPIELLMARIFRDYGHCDETAEHLRQAVAIVEADLEDVVANEAGHVAYFEARLEPYRELIDVLVDQQHVDEAFAVSEAMRARRLRDLTARARLQPRDARSAAEAAEQTALEARLARLNRTLLTAAGAEVALVRQELTAARAELAALELRVSAAHPEAMRRRPLVVADVPAPPEGTAVIEYVVLPRRTIAFVWRRDGSGRPVLAARALPVSRERLAAATQTFVRAIERVDYSVDDSGDVLRKLVFDPLVPDLHGITSLQIVPSDLLWTLPFDALRNADRSYLADHFSISYTPALSFQPHPAPEAARPTLLAFGDPEGADSALARLGDAQEEAEAIGALYGANARVLTGAAATELAFKNDAPAYSVLHLATHGLLDERAPLFSSLLLAPAGGEDGLLEAREILDGRLNAELVVLSACETGRGQIGAGEGIVGMAWAALGGGASTVVVSQWKAESRSTRTLMVDFHRELLAGRGSAEALTRAKRHLKRTPEFAHPFFWASFVVVGAR